MKKYIKLFNNHQGYDDFTKKSDFVKPNVSHCIAENEVHYTPIPDPYNGHAYVDLGLTSGTKWATMNVGATKPEEYGLYFAWGETTGYTASQVGTAKQFSWSDYTFGSTSPFGKYDQDGLTNLELVDDAAAVNWGGQWHIPTEAQYVELLKETKNGFVTNAGAFTQYAWDDNDEYSSATDIGTTITGWDTDGYFFFKNDVSDIDAAIASGDYLFIPDAGSCEGGEVGGVGGVWASALDSEDVEAARHIFFNFNSGRAGVGYESRYYGFSVRGVVG